MKKEKIKNKYNKICLSYKNKYKNNEEWRHLIYKDEISRYIISNYGRIIDLEKGDIPTIYISNRHYYVIIKINKKYKALGIYRLVALAFLPIPQKYFDAGYEEKDLVVDHIRDGDNDNFDDNTIWNLQWVTHRENISKAANCGYKTAYPKEFRDQLDEMILNDSSNKDIYDYFYKLYGYTKEDIKAQIQVRRRRLGKTLKKHYERDKEFINEVDKLLKKGYSNDEIINILEMSKDGRSSSRFLQYRRSILKIPANTSKYFDNNQNEELNRLLVQDISYDEIIKYFNLDKLSYEEKTKIKATLRARRRQCLQKIKQMNVSSTTNESTPLMEVNK